METLKIILKVSLPLLVLFVAFRLSVRQEPTPTVVVVDNHVTDSLRAVLADTESRIDTERAKAEQWRTEADKYKARWLAAKADTAATLPQVVEVADNVIASQDSLIEAQDSALTRCEDYRIAADSLIAERDEAVDKMSAESERLRQRLAEEERGTWWRRNKAWVGVAVGMAVGVAVTN